MQLQEAMKIVNDQLVAESQGHGTDGPARKPYNKALAEHPALMAVAHTMWAQEFYRRNIVQQMQQQQAAAAAQGGQPAPGGTPAPEQGGPAA
jgi:hypothetical protein